MVADGVGHGRRLVDAIGYAIAVAVAVFLVGLAIMVVGGSDWFVVELVMFVLGWLLVGYGTYLLNPEPPWAVTRDEGGDVRGTEPESSSRRRESPFERLVRRLPPISWYPVPPEERLSMGAKLFLGGVFVLIGSLALERLVIV